MDRHIVHVDMDAFFVSVERSRDPSLNGRPVVVGGAPDGGRGVVAAASYEARRYGIHSAMPAARARKLCPHAVFLRGSAGLYVRISRAVREIFRSWTPLVEMTSIDEAYLDLTGFDRCHGPVVGTVDRIIRQVRGTFGLDLSAGIATNRLVAKIASRKAKPAGLLRVLPGREEQFMAALPLADVPGVGESLETRLSGFGLATVGDLRRLDRSLLERVFGSTGAWLYDMARGRGGLHVESERPQARSVGHERTFSEDTLDREFLEGVLYRLSEKVGARLRRKGLVGRTVSLKLRYEDFRTLTRSDSSGEGTASDMEIYERARGLMLPLLARRVRVRLLGVTASGLRAADGQLDLFRARSQRRDLRFYGTLDRLRDKYGFDCVQKGPAILLDNLRQPPGAGRKAG